MPSGKRDFRQNPLTGEWVIYSPNRGQRPDDFEDSADPQGKIPAYDPDCPFCPGNEDLLPDILQERDHPQENRWMTRVVSNKFPIVSDDIHHEHRRGFGHHPPSHTQTDPLFPSASVSGSHEVLIESSRHNHRIPEMSPKEFQHVLTTYQDRYRIYQELDRIQAVVLFRNHGAGAGTSLRHPHAQLIALDILPKHILEREKRAQAYHQQQESCLICDLIQRERERGKRVIAENEAYLSVVPFFARSPYEIWILPKVHQTYFGSIPGENSRLLAASLQNQLRRLDQVLDDPDYNYVIQGPPSRGKTDPAQHWHLQILPRISRPAGFEIGSGMQVNTSVPEQDAQQLREITSAEF
jgi:UDPglucose--hexose-1-phosphate uridylyltransferase